mmetsp:Transcript_23342/g.69950  ORF Transcript_23342/g.69950 Transcript_23342/m.69950 type:complete len:435 (-) Transcript_23342:82-1386(-)
MRLGLAVAGLCGLASGAVIDIETAGAKADDDSWDQVWKNGAVLNQTLAKLAPGDVWIVPNKTFYVMGGIIATNLKNVTIQLDGTLAFASDDLHFEEYLDHFPRDGSGHVLECLHFISCVDITFTSSGEVGTLAGHGQKWWGIPGIGYLARGENRPRLLRLQHFSSVLVEKFALLQSPYWTFYANSVDGLEVRHSVIDARRIGDDGHSVIDETAFNTDGFDVSGNNVWIHDCTVWNQDDSFCVKDGSTNMVFERINASGVGLTIGSIGGSVVRNITFRDAYMHNSVKGIYLKFRGGNGSVSDVLYENIVIDHPEQWAIWIGPAQQSDSKDLCAAHPCSICWPEVPGAVCPGVVGAQYANITLRNVTVNSPKQSPGVLIADAATPMKNVLFDNVKINNPGKSPWGNDFYRCENVEGVATGTTDPVPPCFKKGGTAV